MINSNSFESLKHLLNHVNENDCKWTLIIIDGVSYITASTLKESFIFCNLCKEQIRNIVDINELEKLNTIHNLVHNIILPGSCYSDVNMGCLLSKLLWVPFLKKIVTFVGFSIEKAQLVAKNRIDHHQTQHILLTFLFALTKGLLVPLLVYQMFVRLSRFQLLILIV